MKISGTAGTVKQRGQYQIGDVLAAKIPAMVQRSHRRTANRRMREPERQNRGQALVLDGRFVAGQSRSDIHRQGSCLHAKDNTAIATPVRRSFGELTRLAAQRFSH